MASRLEFQSASGFARFIGTHFRSGRKALEASCVVTGNAGT